MNNKTFASYVLSTYSFIFSRSLDTLLRVGYMESDDAIPIPSFEESLLINLCKEAIILFETEKNLLEINGDTIVVGDIHGSFHDLLRIIKFTQGKRSNVLFLGDYVDRGNFSLECITILFALKVMYPDTFYLIRGNHEFDQLCSQYGFKDEITNYHNPKIPKALSSRRQQKLQDESNNIPEFYSSYQSDQCYRYSKLVYDSFINTFSYLPLAAIINRDTFCIHGGLSPKLDHVDDINKLIQRPIHEFEESNLLSDLLWSDPANSPNFPFVKNTRGRGFLFNKEAVNNFLRKNLIKRIIRSHECVENGTLKNFGDNLITVFSSSLYDTFLKNKSGVIQFFESDSKFRITNFDPIPRLQKSEAIYYKVQTLIKNESSSSIYPCFSFLHPNLKQLKASSQNFSPIRSCTSNMVPSMRPRFTTNRRQSFEIRLKDPPVASKAIVVNSDNDDDVIQNRNHSKRLPSNLLSFSDSNFISDDE